MGRLLVRFGIALAVEVSERVACRYVTLDSQPDLVDWYGFQGFVSNRLRQAERVQDALRHNRDPERVPVSMRFDLRGI